MKLWAGEAGKILDGSLYPFYDLDLAYIRFTIAQYEFMAEARDQLLAAAEAYEQACKMQRIEPAGSPGGAGNALEIIRDLKYRFESSGPISRSVGYGEPGILEGPGPA